MRDRLAHAFVVVTLAHSWACFSSRDGGGRPDAGDPDAGDPDAGRPACVDGDGDGWGEGPHCLGPDCDDDDAAVHAICGECGNGDSEACYEGAPVTDGVGACHPGTRECVGDAWGPCVGAVEPDDETCNAADDDCDGVVDEGVTSPCGDCDPGCRVVCVGAGCAQAFELGAGAALTADGAVGPAPGATDIARHVVWIAGGHSQKIYQVDTATLEVVGGYAVEAPRAYRWTVVADTWGNAFVAFDNRDAPHGLLRIDTGNCTDSNGDGVITTSSGLHDVLRPGEDDCVRWRSHLGDQSRLALALGPDERLWVAGEDDQQGLLPLDPETGKLDGDAIESIADPNVLLGVADGLWIGGGRDLCHLDTATLEQDCHVVGDGAVLELELAEDGALLSSTPLLRWDAVSGEPSALIEQHIDDFAISDEGALWVQPGEDSDVLHRYRYGDPLGDFEVLDLDRRSRTIIADADRQVWTISDNPGWVTVYDAETAEPRGVVFDDCHRDECVSLAGLAGDPAAARLRRAFPNRYERAEAGAVIEATCAPGERRRWTLLAWEASAETPLLIEIRTAATREALAIAPWSLHVRTPPAAGSLPLALDVASRDAFLEMRTRFRSQSARLDRVELRWRCDP